MCFQERIFFFVGGKKGEKDEGGGRRSHKNFCWQVSRGGGKNKSEIHCKENQEKVSGLCPHRHLPTDWTGLSGLLK